MFWYFSFCIQKIRKIKEHTFYFGQMLFSMGLGSMVLIFFLKYAKLKLSSEKLYMHTNTKLFLWCTVYCIFFIIILIQDVLREYKKMFLNWLFNIKTENSK